MRTSGRCKSHPVHRACAWQHSREGMRPPPPERSWQGLVRSRQGVATWRLPSADPPTEKPTRSQRIRQRYHSIRHSKYAASRFAAEAAPALESFAEDWRDYDESLRRRGSLTVWFSDEAVEAWEAERRTSRGGQPAYSDLAILTALTFKAVFRLAYRQTEGLIGSVIGLLGLDLAVPDHTTLCRRAETLEGPRPKPPGDGADSGARRDTGPMHLLVDSTGLKLIGAGEWLVEKHGTKRRRSWRKMHLGVDARTGWIVAATLTDRDEDDAAQVGPLLDQVADPVASVTADGAYDQESVYADVAERHPEAAIIVPPRSTAVPSQTAETAPTQRDRHLQLIAEKGRMGWQKATGYNARARAEAAISRYKRVIGDGLHARTDRRRVTEVNVGVHALNRMLELGRPESVRIA